MDADPTLKADIELFRRMMRVMGVLQRQPDTLAEHMAPAPAPRKRPRLSPDLDVRRRQLDSWARNVAVEADFASTEDEDEDDEFDERVRNDGEIDGGDDFDSDDWDESDFDSDDDEADEEDDDDDNNDDNDGENPESDEVSDRVGQLFLPKEPDNALAPQSYANRNSNLQAPPIQPTHPVPANRSAQNVGPDGGDDAELRCWRHGCNGRRFTTRSNLRRHLREKSQARPACICPQCGAVFSRTTARNNHVARNSCVRIRRYSNGRIRPRPRIKNDLDC